MDLDITGSRAVNGLRCMPMATGMPRGRDFGPAPRRGNVTTPRHSHVTTHGHGSRVAGPCFGPFSDQKLAILALFGLHIVR